jgi:RNA polymerase sigma-70 factor (ECF subfamily)
MGDEVGGRSDAELVLGIARGDQVALGELYRRHGGAVWGLARRVTSDAHAAEEVCQTVFMQVWTAPERFDPNRGTLRSYLLAQAHRRAVDLVRSEEARRRRQAREAQLAPPPPPEVEATAHAAALAGDVRRAVEALPPGERDAIMLAYFGGRTYRETATLLGQPEGTVKSRIRSGLQNLRRALRAEGVTP